MPVEAEGAPEQEATITGGGGSATAPGAQPCTQAAPQQTQVPAADAGGQAPGQQSAGTGDGDNATGLVDDNKNPLGGTGMRYSRPSSRVCQPKMLRENHPRQTVGTW